MLLLCIGWIDVWCGEKGGLKNKYMEGWELNLEFGWIDEWRKISVLYWCKLLDGVLQDYSSMIHRYILRIIIGGKGVADREVGQDNVLIEFVKIINWFGILHLISQYSEKRRVLYWWIFLYIPVWSSAPNISFWKVPNSNFCWWKVYFIRIK